MSADNRIWIGQDGERYGPYSEDEIRQWLQEGRVTADTLAWREGMTDWAPLGSFFAMVATASTPAPPLPPGMPPLSRRPVDGPFGSGVAAARSATPEPPEMHWGVVLLLSIVTLGIFAIFWAFTQAAWVRRIDPRSNATWLLGMSIACFFIGEPLYFIGIFHGMRNGQPEQSDLLTFGGMLLFARWVLYVVAYFSMAGSISKYLKARGVQQHIGGATLFFFPMFFLQANLSWLARWRRTGQTSPRPSRGIFWGVFLALPIVLGMLFGFAVAAFKSGSNEVRIDIPRTQSAPIVAALADVKRPVVATGEPKS